MTPPRVAEILAAYGADPARWPAEERLTCTALIVADPALKAAQARAAALDASLAAWALHPPADVIAAERAAVRALAALSPAAAPSRRGWLPWAGGALAASVAAALYLAPGPAKPAAPRFARPTVALNPAQADSELFRATFTPTPEEEDVL